MKISFAALIWVLAFSTVAIAQTSKASKPKFGYATTFRYKKDYRLLHEIDTMRYDSVKIYSFCDKLGSHPKLKYTYIFAPNEDFIGPEQLVDERERWANNLADDGQAIAVADLRKVTDALKFSYRDVVHSDPSGCYSPRIAVVFFKNGHIKSHIDICLQCRRVVFEKFGQQKIAYKEYWPVLTPTMDTVFKALCQKYQLGCCGK
jgi:hypothetical protein